MADAQAQKTRSRLPVTSLKRGPTSLLPLPPPDKGGSQVSPRHVPGGSALTCAWDTASSRFPEAGGQDALLASAPRSQDPLLNTPPSIRSPYPGRRAASRGGSSDRGFLIQAPPGPRVPVPPHSALCPAGTGWLPSLHAGSRARLRGPSSAPSARPERGHGRASERARGPHFLVCRLQLKVEASVQEEESAKSTLAAFQTL